MRQIVARRLCRWAAGCSVALLMGVAGGALGAPCAGFSDVEDSSAFCANVEWLKNRQITLGCTSSTLYCPAAAVSRLSMAAFMNRLGTALTPVQLPVDVSPGAIDLDAGLVVCQTPDFAVTDYPRRAYVDLSFSGRANADVGVAADVAMSTNGGASWTNLNTVANRGFVTANQWGDVVRPGLRRPGRGAKRALGRAHGPRRHRRGERPGRQPLPAAGAGAQP